MNGPNDEPMPIKLMNLSKDITHCWEELAMELGVGEGDREAISTNYIEYPSLNKKAHQMLKTWRNSGSSTNGKLAKALAKVGQGHFVKKHGIPQVNNWCSVI